MVTLKTFFEEAREGRLIGIRCLRCGEIFTMGMMLKKYKERQKSAPPGMYYAKCPGCGKEDHLTLPEIFLTQGPLKGQRKPPKGVIQ